MFIWPSVRFLLKESGFVSEKRDFVVIFLQQSFAFFDGEERKPAAEERIVADKEEIVWKWEWLY